MIWAIRICRRGTIAANRQRNPAFVFRFLPPLLPSSRRIASALAVFGGREYQLEPGDNFGTAFNGFVALSKRSAIVCVVESGAWPRLSGEFQALRANTARYLQPAG